MAASFPTTVKAFTTKLTNDTIEAAHMNDVQDEIVALESSVLNYAQNVVTMYGAAGDGSTDDTAAIQAAITAAATGSGIVYLPAGIYIISANLTIAATTRFIGDGKALSQIKATSLCTRILEFTATLVRCGVEQLYLNCNGVATSGIYGASLSHSTFRTIQISGAKAVGTNPAAIMIGATAGGWDNYFDDVDVNGCAADGVYLMGTCNSNVFSACKIFSNTGWGIVALSSSTVKIMGCTIESNAAGGIMVQAGVPNLDIDNCYFLSNAATGFVFASPVITIKCDVLINGSSARTTMAAAFLSTGVRIANCSCTPGASTQDCFVFSAGSDGLTVTTNTIDASAAGYGIVPVLGSHWSTAANRAPRWQLDNNFGFGVGIAFFGVSGVLEYDARGAHIDNIAARNFTLIDLPLWINSVAGTAATWLPTILTMNGITIPVWNLHSTAAGTSHVFGFQIDAALYPDLFNRYVMFGMWTKSDATDKGPNLYVGTGVQNNGNALTTNWTWQSGIVKWPTSGTLTFGAIKNGTATGDVYFAAPILVEIGADYYTVFGRVPTWRTWTIPTFDAAMYTASTGAWTVIAGNVTTFTYELVGKTLRVHFFIDATNVTGAAAALKIALPQSLVARKRQIGTLLVQDAGGAAAMSNCEVQAAGTTIDCYKAPNAGANWTITAGNNTRVQGYIELEVI